VKRFWTEVAIEPVDGGFGVRLDGRPVKTPARVDLVLPNRALADAVAAEWSAVDGDIDPRTMPLTGFANAAIDRVATGKEAFAADIARYGESDLTCYRADGPDPLVARQAESWDALQAWARRRYDVDFTCVSGVIHQAQPEETVARLGQAVHALDPFRLAALSPMVSIGGSLIAGLAVVEKALPPSEAWEAVSLDDRWQLEQWGADPEAQARLDARRDDFLAAARFLELLD